MQYSGKFCIPAPVIGGVIFAVFTCICYVTGIAEFSFDDILKDVCMVFFFTSVGFQANLKVLKSGGKALIVFLGLVIGLNSARISWQWVLRNFFRSALWWVYALVPFRWWEATGLPCGFGPILEDFGNLRSYDPLYRGRYLRPDCRQHDGRPFGKTSDREKEPLRHCGFRG